MLTKRKYTLIVRTQIRWKDGKRYVNTIKRKVEWQTKSEKVYFRVKIITMNIRIIL